MASVELTEHTGKATCCTICTTELDRLMQENQRLRKALGNIAQIDNNTDADAAADYAIAVLSGANVDAHEDGSPRAWWAS